MSYDQSIHSGLDLYISDESFTIIPSKERDQPSLIINRSNSQISLGPTGPPSKFDKTFFGFSGIFGIIRLIRSDYLILIKSSRKVSNVLNTTIYTSTQFSVYPISLESNQSLLEDSDERFLLSILKENLDQSNGKIFFSYDKRNSNQSSSSSSPPDKSSTWDPTTRLQAQIQSDQNRAEQNINSYEPLWRRADDRFFWNKFLNYRLIELAQRPESQAASRFILPVIFGFLEFRSTSINGKTFNFGLVSRRSRFRAGTRYFSRGIDLDGNVSNFNETETIFYTTTTGSNNNSSNGKKVIKASFVQTRGSVPVFWTEINNLRYKPDLKIMDIPQTQEAIKAHFDQQVEIYGDQYLVNLVNSTGYERPIKEAYEKSVRELGNPRVHYVYFDFHHECRGLRFDRVQLLIDNLEDDLIRNQGYFYLDQKVDNDHGSISSSLIDLQRSVVRTNCMDCLDRTNVVQSSLSKWTLTLQLRRAGIIDENESLDSHPGFMLLFRNIWADNADVVSKAYSGTGALKTDFTRFGIRSKRGALNDLMNSIVRYIKNNYLDGPRQDSYDLVTGNWSIDNDEGFVNDDDGGGFDYGNDDDHEKVKVKKRNDRGTLNSYYRSRLDRSEFEMRLLRNNPIHQIVLFIFIIFLLIFISATFTKKRSFKLSIISLLIVSLTMTYILMNGREFINLPRLKSREIIISYEGPGYQSSRNGTGIKFLNDLNKNFQNLNNNNNNSNKIGSNRNTSGGNKLKKINNNSIGKRRSNSNFNSNNGSLVGSGGFVDGGGSNYKLDVIDLEKKKRID